MARRSTKKKRSSASSRANGRDRPEYVPGYKWDAAAAEAPCQFIEAFCRGVNAAGDPAPMKLIPWQREVMSSLFGWKRPNGRLRYRRGALFIPKKNGKSFCMAALCQYLMLAHKPLADVFPAAVDREQARLIFRSMAQSIQASPLLSRELEVVDYKSIIRNKRHGNILRCLSADAWRNEGLNGSVVIDEIHAHKSPALIDALSYATRATPNGLVLTISTAGDDRNSVGYQWWQDAELVTKNPAANPTFYGKIFAADPTDDFSDPKVWRKANPSMGTTFPEDEFAADYQDALTNPRKMSQWLRYSLNVWREGDARWFPGDSWSQCSAGPTEPIEGRACWVGVDLASNLDMTAACMVFREPDGTYYAEWRYWVPRDTVAARIKENIPYDAWIRDGWVIVTDGARLDHETVARDIIALSERHQVLGVGVDPWQAGALQTLLQRAGLSVVSVPQRTTHLNAACKLLEGLVAERKLRTGGNPVAEWNANNVCCYTDSTGMIKPDKAKSAEKIDGIAALVNGLALASVAEATSWDLVAL